jgi:hypothetical protein
MKLHGLHACIWSAVAGAVLALGAHDAHAGGFSPFVGPTTVHAFTAQVKGAAQDVNKHDDDVIGRDSVNQKDLAGACLDRSLSKSEKIVLVTDCGDQSNPFVAYILVVNTAADPATIVDDLGQATLIAVARKEDKNGVTKQIEYDMAGSLACNPGFHVDVSGYVKASFKPLDPKVQDSPVCMQSANGKALGTAVLGEPRTVVVENMSLKAGARSSKINVPAASINTWFAPPAP